MSRGSSDQNSTGDRHLCFPSLSPIVLGWRVRRCWYRCSLGSLSRVCCVPLRVRQTRKGEEEEEEAEEKSETARERVRAAARSVYRCVSVRDVLA